VYEHEADTVQPLAPLIAGRTVGPCRRPTTWSLFWRSSRYDDVLWSICVLRTVCDRNGVSIVPRYFARFGHPMGSFVEPFVVARASSVPYVSAVPRGYTLSLDVLLRCYLTCVCYP
jgi:hypothetical protein